MRVVTSKQLDNTYLWDFLAVQWLRLHASTVGGTGSIPGQGSSTCQAVWSKKKNKKTENQKSRRILIQTAMKIALV